MPLQPRAGQPVLQTQTERSGIRRPPLRRPGVVQRRRVSGQEPRHAQARRRATAHIQFFARKCIYARYRRGGFTIVCRDNNNNNKTSIVSPVLFCRC